MWNKVISWKNPVASTNYSLHFQIGSEHPLWGLLSTFGHEVLTVDEFLAAIR